MRIIAFTTTYWDNLESSRRPEITDPIFGLRAWHDRVRFLFSPTSIFLACGTWSDPALNPLDGLARVVNAGIPVGIPYNVHRHQYCMAAYTAAMAHLLDRQDWDLAVLLDTDCLVGAVNFPKLIDEFLKRPDFILTNAWCRFPAGPLVVFKREACVRLLHHRIQGNIVLHDDSDDLMLAEWELGEIFKGVWWNPWPQIESVRQDFPMNPDDPDPLQFLRCPFIRQPNPKVIQPFLESQWSKVVPL